jgi:hypothetical protein
MEIRRNLGVQKILLLPTKKVTARREKQKIACWAAINKIPLSGGQKKPAIV